MISEERRRQHQCLVIIHDVDADPAARIEACDRLLRSIYEERKGIELLTGKTLVAMLRRDLKETRADLKRAMVRRRTVGVA